MNITSLSKRDKKVVETLHPILEEGESVEGIVEIQNLNIQQALVITSTRFIFAYYLLSPKLQKNQKGVQPISFSRFLVKEISYNKLTSSIKLHFSDDVLSLRVRKINARKTAKQLAANFHKTQVEKPEAQRMLTDLQTLEKNFNIIRSADTGLQEVHGEYAGKADFEKYLSERILSLRTAAGIVGGHVLFNLFNDLLFGFEIDYLFETVIFYGVTGWLIFGLLTFRPNARMWAIIISLIPFLFSFLNLLSGGEWLSVVLNGLLPGGLLLVLAGPPSRKRTITGGLLYLLMILVSFLFSVLAYLYQTGLI